MTQTALARALIVPTLIFAFADAPAEEIRLCVENRDGRVIEVLDRSGSTSSTTLAGEVRPAACSTTEPITAADRRAVATRATDGVTHVTIDWMTTTGGYSTTYQPGGTIRLLGRADTYHLSDGTSWQSGAGSYTQTFATLDHVEVVGDTMRAVLTPPADGVLYRQTDFDGGDHSAQGTLGAVGPLVIEAVIGSSRGVITGEAEIVANEITSYGEPRFNFYSSVAGSIVPFELAYDLTAGAWTPETFDTAFSYATSGVVDFANPSWVPTVTDVEIHGSAQVPDESSIPYTAVVRYENDIEKDVTNEASWFVEPASFASIDHGLLTTGALDDGELELTILVEYAEGGVVLQSEKVVLCRDGGSAELPGAWPTFQANGGHTGYTNLPVEPTDFNLLWQRTFDGPLNPVTGADGKVFVSRSIYFDDVPALFALDARDGEPLWSKSFGDVFSVNPPAYAYGNVYVQTGNHSSDTYLHAFDADSGERVFQSPHAAQWERYYAPTIHDGTVYVDGGTYGGMYAFDAFSGEQRWFHSLPQYDEWTPAVDEELAYAYVGEYSPGLYALDRLTGEQRFMIPDPEFDWNGWSMDLAPVLGGFADAIAIHDGRLISFDLENRSIRWVLQRAFTGQPSVAQGTIYAIDNGGLVALDEQSGDDLWSWQPPAGTLRDSIVVTHTHLFATTASNVYAVELLSHTDEWSYPVSGHLALADETLYVASADGTLTAVSLPEHVPAVLVALEIDGPDEVVEQTTAKYTAFAHYDDGRVRDRSHLTEWTVEPGTYADFDATGTLTVGELLTPRQSVVVAGTYAEGGVRIDAQKPVELVIGVTLEDFVRRNIATASESERELLAGIEQALVRLRAARAAGGNLPQSTLEPLERAILWSEEGHADLERSLNALLAALEKLAAPGSPEGGATRAGPESRARPERRSPPRANRARGD